MTDKEAISNLNQIYGFVSSEIQQSLDLAIKALEEQCEKDNSNEVQYGFLNSFVDMLNHYKHYIWLWLCSLL